MTLKEAMKKARRDYLNALLVETKGSIRAAAKIAGIQRSDFYKYFSKGQCERPLIVAPAVASRIARVRRLHPSIHT